MATTIGSRIAYLRTRQGIDGAEFARRAGISKVYLHEIEHGRKGDNLGLAVAMRIAAALGISVTYLAGELELLVPCDHHVIDNDKGCGKCRMCGVSLVVTEVAR